LSTPPQAPAIADALRALGPDYEQALVDSIAARVDELARQREARGQGIPPVGPHPQQLPVPHQAPQPPPPHPAQQFPGAPPGQVPPAPGQQHRSGTPPGAGVPISILSLIFGFVLSIIALTAGFSDGGPAALIAILIIWAALVLINMAVWIRPGR
jgi:hypothetical protein